MVKLNQQEEEVEKCSSCKKMVFHKNCFKKVASCPCGARFKPEETKRSCDGVVSHLSSPGGLAEPSRLLSGLFSMVMPRRSLIARKPESETVGNIIPMGSLPTTSLWVSTKIHLNSIFFVLLMWPQFVILAQNWILSSCTHSVFCKFSFGTGSIYVLIPPICLYNVLICNQTFSNGIADNQKVYDRKFHLVFVWDLCVVTFHGGVCVMTFTSLKI